MRSACLLVILGLACGGCGGNRVEAPHHARDVALPDKATIQDEAIIRELLEALKLGHIEERNNAFLKLLDCAPHVLAAVEAVRTSDDLEVRHLASIFPRAYGIHTQLTPTIKALRPGAALHLATNDYHKEWIKLFLEMGEMTDGVWTLPIARRSDLEILSQPALSGIATLDDLERYIGVVKQWNIKRAILPLLKALSDPKGVGKHWMEGSTRILLLLLRLYDELPLDAHMALLQLPVSDIPEPALFLAVCGTSSSVDTSTLARSFLDHTKPDVKAEAIRVLVRSQWDGCARLVSEALKTGSADLQREVAERVSVSARSSALTAALALFEDPRDSTRLASIKLAATSAAPEVLSALVDRIANDKNDEVVAAAVEVLRCLENPIGADACLAKLKNGNTNTSLIAYVGDHSGASAWPVLAPLLANRREAVRVATLRAVAASKCEQAIDQLLRFAESGSRDESVCAIRAIGRLSHPQGNEILRKRIADEGSGSNVRIVAFGAMRDTVDIPLSIKALCSNDYAVRSAATLALIRSADRLREDTVVPLFENGEAAVRGAVINVLGVAGVGRGRIAGALGDPAPIVRCAALKAVQSAEGGEIPQRVRDLLRDADPTVRAAALLCVAFRGVLPEEAYLSAVQDPSPEVYRAACYASFLMRSSSLAADFVKSAEGLSYMDLDMLNCIESGGLWRAASGSKWGSESWLLREELKELLEARLKVRIDSPAMDWRSVSGGRQPVVEGGAFPATVLDALTQLSARYGKECWVVDGGNIKLLSRLESLDFWAKKYGVR